MYCMEKGQTLHPMLSKLVLQSLCLQLLDCTTGETFPGATIVLWNVAVELAGLPKITSGKGSLAAGQSKKASRSSSERKSAVPGNTLQISTRTGHQCRSVRRPGPRDKTELTCGAGVGGTNARNGVQVLGDYAMHVPSNLRMHSRNFQPSSMN